MCARVKTGVFYALCPGCSLQRCQPQQSGQPLNHASRKTHKRQTPHFCPFPCPLWAFNVPGIQTTTQTAKAAQIENSGKLALRRNTAVLPERIAPFSVRAKYSSSGQPSGRFSVPSSCSSRGGSLVSFSVLSSSCIFAGLFVPFSSASNCSSFAGTVQTLFCPVGRFPSVSSR